MEMNVNEEKEQPENTEESGRLEEAELEKVAGGFMIYYDPRDDK
jgi:hypothetical protein